MYFQKASIPLCTMYVYGAGRCTHTVLHQPTFAHTIMYVMVQAGVVRLQCSRKDPLVFTGCLDGGVRVWDVRGGECVREWWGHTKDLLDLTIARYVFYKPQ